MPKFPRKSAVFPRVRIPASRPNKHLQKPTCQELTLAVSERFARLRGAHVFRHVGFCWFSLGSAFGHKFAPMIGSLAEHLGPVRPGHRLRRRSTSATGQAPASSSADRTAVLGT